MKKKYFVDIFYRSRNRTNLFNYFFLILIFSVFGCDGQRIEKDSVTVVSWGGKYQEALFEKWINPSAKKANIRVLGRTYTGEYNTITRMVESSAVTWDLVQVETFYAEQAINSRLVEKFDPPVPSDKIVVRESFNKSNAYRVPTIGWSYVLAWNQEVLEQMNIEPERNPKDWSDFWDLNTYPGKRGVRDVPQGNIEIALLADGLSIEQIRKELYLNRDLKLIGRAFRKLDQIKDHIVWWTSGNQIQRELEAGSVVLAATWNGRVWKAITDPLIRKDTNCKIELCYNQAILDYDWWIIPKGSANINAASKLVKEMYNNVEGAIDFAKEMGYGPPIKGWEEILASNNDLLQFMPTTQQNAEKQLEVSPKFWADNHTYIQERWRSWRAE